MNKDFSQDDRVRLKDKGGGEPSPLPTMPCNQARHMTDSFKQGALSAGETFLLGLHLVDSTTVHTPECPSHDEALKDQVKAALRNSGE